MFLGTHEDVAIHARLAKKLRQVRMVAETIDVIANGRHRSEAALEIPLTEEGLPHKTFTTRQIAIGFDPPATNDTPAVIFHRLLNAGEQARIGLLDKFIVRGTRTREDEPRKFVDTVEGGPAGGGKRFETFRHRPHPCRIEMGITGEVEHGTCPT